jgi:hypothetical protein
MELDLFESLCTPSQWGHLSSGDPENLCSSFDIAMAGLLFLPLSSYGNAARAPAYVWIQFECILIYLTNSFLSIFYRS